MISDKDAMNRALAAIETTYSAPEYHRAVKALLDDASDGTVGQVKTLCATILAIAANAIRAEFAAGNHWQVVEIEPEKFAIQHATTGEFYKAKTRGNGRRLVTFRFIERAKIAAHIRNAR
jgi:hypothetical protein